MAQFRHMYANWGKILNADIPGNNLFLVNPCENNNGDCHDDAECINDYDGTADCVCKPGFTGDGKTECECISLSFISHISTITINSSPPFLLQ